jgi:Lar family restriction alleviation protein
MADLHPCPFCGKTPVVRISMQEYPADGVHPAGEYDAWYNICCDECGIEVGAEYRSEAIAAWERRTPPHQAFAGFDDVPDPLPMQAEIWAAGADTETARFVARMLGDWGYSLVKADPE